jgi:hypothetical protein
MKYLYKYPQSEYPYQKLMQENIFRDREVPEYELLDTDIFDENRYWDIVIEVATPATINNSTPKILTTMRKRIFACGLPISVPKVPHYTSSHKLVSGIHGPGVVLMHKIHSNHA